jgi:hypothetical protein
MKLATRILSLLILAGLATFYVSCDKGGGEKKSEAETQFGKLMGSWELVTANVDGTDRTLDFPNLTLTLSGTFAQGGTYNYSFTGTRPNPSPWPAQGTWKFDTNVGSEIIRDPSTASELELNYTVTDSGLVVTFTVPDGSTGWAGGTTRQNIVSGNWTFTFSEL